MRGSPYQTAVIGWERYDARTLPRHRHAAGYVTLVLHGGYVEAGDAGRFRAREGDILVHREFEAHQDSIDGASAVLNLPLMAEPPEGGLFAAEDPDAVVRLAERDVRAAAAMLRLGKRVARDEEDWPDLLAAQLRKDAPICLGEWAREHGLAPDTISRGFRRLYGTTAARYRVEARTRRAWRAISRSDRSLADIALDTGFADQAHMTRSVVEMTGFAPGGWRSGSSRNQLPAR